MKPSNTPSRARSTLAGALALSLVGCVAYAGCASTLSNEHEPRSDAPLPSQSELQQRAEVRAQRSLDAERTLEDAPTAKYQIRYIKRPNPAGTPPSATLPNAAQPGIYNEQPQAFPPGCECTVQASTLAVTIPCGQSACVNETQFECVDDDKLSKSDACAPASSCQCNVDSDGAGPKGFAMECDTKLCFDGRITSCGADGTITRGESCGS